MRQAIQTTYYGPTNARGSRVKAAAYAKTITVQWDHRLNVEENHKAAAEKLARLMGWEGQWQGGALPGTGYCFVVGSIFPDDFFVIHPDKETV